MSQEDRERKLRNLKEQIAIYNEMIEERERLIKLGQEILEKAEAIKAQKEAESEEQERQIAFLKECIRRQEERLKKRP